MHVRRSFPAAFARRAAHRQSGWRRDRRAAGVPRRRGTRNAGKESEPQLQVASSTRQRNTQSHRGFGSAVYI